jgi:hypothetical protein
MSDEIVSALITASSTFLSTGVLGVAAIVISDRINKIKENNRKLLDDWEFLYYVEDLLLKEIEEKTNISTRTKKIECRKLISEKLNRKIHFDGLSNINKLKSK